MVFETPVAAVKIWGTVEVEAPRLALRDATGAMRHEVPMVDLEWHLILPTGRRLVRSSGTVAAEVEVATPLSRLLQAGSQAIAIVRNEFKPKRTGAEGPEAKGEPSVSSDSFSYMEKAGADFQLRQKWDARDARTAFNKDGAVRTDVRGPVLMQSSPTIKSTADDPSAAYAAAEAAGANVGGREQTPSPTPPVLMSGRLAQPGEAGQGARPHCADGLTGHTDAGKAFWALRGVRSLPIDVGGIGEQVTFRSMGVDPRLVATLVSDRNLGYLSAALALFIGILGVAMTNRSAASQVRFVLMAFAVVIISPMVIGLVADVELSGVFEPAVYVCCGLVAWYVLAGVVSWLAAGARRMGSSAEASRVARAAACLLVCACLAQIPASAQLKHERKLDTRCRP